MFFLYIILFVFLFILLLGVGIINTIFRLFFGRRHSTQQENNQQQSQQTGGNRNRWNSRANDTSSKKVFADDEGEYIEFEEIKDN